MSASMPRFVVLEHDHPTRHWDFMLEVGEVLRTWRLAAPPANGQMIAAEPSFDHRLLYLDYEGPISGNRGSVSRWDAGTYEWQENAAERLVVVLTSERLCGCVTLTKKTAQEWTMQLEGPSPME
jgi:hypothetical protein